MMPLLFSNKRTHETTVGVRYLPREGESERKRKRKLKIPTFICKLCRIYVHTYSQWDYVYTNTTDVNGARRLGRIISLLVRGPTVVASRFFLNKEIN